jgi:hypothetical protein
MFRSLLLPAAAGGLVIFGLSFYEQVFLRDYWSKPGAEAELMGQRFAQVPKEIGPWKGQDLSVDAQVKKTAGAVSYVSRLYKNEETGREVKLRVPASAKKAARFAMKFRLKEPTQANSLLASSLRTTFMAVTRNASFGLGTIPTSKHSKANGKPPAMHVSTMACPVRSTRCTSPAT